LLKLLLLDLEDALGLSLFCSSHITASARMTLGSQQQKTNFFHSYHMLGAFLLVGDDGEKLQNFTDPICTKLDITRFKVGWRLTYQGHKLWIGIAQSV